MQSASYPNATASITDMGDGIKKLTITCEGSSLQPMVGASVWANTGGGSGTLVEVGGVQVEYGSTSTAYQLVTSINDITETAVPEVWHLFNDGGDSLPAILPAGAYEIAWVNHLGAVSYASATSDGTTGTNLLRAERMADVLAREGTFAASEKTALEAYWQQRYAA